MWEIGREMLKPSESCPPGNSIDTGVCTVTDIVSFVERRVTQADGAKWGLGVYWWQ